MVTGLSWKEMERSQALGPQHGWSSDAAALSNRLLHSPAILKKLPWVRLPDVHNPDVSAPQEALLPGLVHLRKGSDGFRRPAPGFLEPLGCTRTPLRASGGGVGMNALHTISAGPRWERMALC